MYCCGLGKVGKAVKMRFQAELMTYEWHAAQEDYEQVIVQVRAHESRAAPNRARVDLGRAVEHAAKPNEPHAPRG